LLGILAVGRFRSTPCTVAGNAYVCTVVLCITGSCISHALQLDFLSEAEMMKWFDHKNIVKLLGVCTRGEPVYAVMEFMLHGMLTVCVCCSQFHTSNKICFEKHSAS